MNKVPFRTDFTPLAGPIAVVTTVDGEGRVNVAPMSWISHICRKPPLLVIGSHRSHHTVQNLLANGECVLNFPADNLARQAWEAQHFLAPSFTELEQRGFTPVPAERVRPPRLKECPAHMEARLESVKWYGDECVLFVEEVARSMDQAAAEAPDPYAVLRPIFYVGPGTYGVVERSAKAVKHDADPFTLYVVQHKRRPDRPYSEALIRAHIAHLRHLDAAGRLVLCGPFGDNGGGMAIIRAESLDEARALGAADPFVVEGAVDQEVRVWHLSCEANNHMGFGD